MRTYSAVIERDPDTGLFVGFVPGFPGAHSQGATLDELNSNLREVIAMLLEEFEGSLMDDNIATSLLAGIIAETNSFQHAKTTPRAFLKASELIARGGRHQEIVRELYKTKSIPLLKLWGRALARLRELPDLKLVYSLVNYLDIEKTGSKAEDVFGVMKGLVANLSGVKFILFLAEIAPRAVVGYFHLHPGVNTQIVSSALSAQMLNGSLGRFSLADVNFLDVEKEVLDKLGRIKDQISM